MSEAMRSIKCGNRGDQVVRTSGKWANKWWGVALLAAVAGCSSPPANTGGGGGATAPPATTNAGGTGGTSTAGKAIKVGVVLDTGGVDDKSFNAAANAGLEQAKSGLNIDKSASKYVSSNSPSDYKSNLTNFAAQGYDLIVAVGYKMQNDMTAVAPQFPNVKFALVDGKAPAAPNCASLLFKEEQGSFLAGFLAASVTKTKTIGFVGGEAIDLIHKFEAGYKAGAQAANPQVKVIVAYTGDWNDVGKGKGSAQQQFGNGADIIFHAAGKAGLGVISAAQEKGPGFYAIGVDQDQDGVAPGRVLTSMVKHLDTAVFDTIKTVQSGTFAPGDHVFDLKQNGVGLSEMKYTKQDVPADVMTRLDKVKQMIADGQITVPTTLEELKTFAPPKL